MMAMRSKRKGPQYEVPPLSAKSITVSLDMLTWNIAGSKSEGHFAAIRDTLMPIVRRQLPDYCVSFLQEISTGAQSVKGWGFDDLVLSSEGGKKEAGMSIPQRQIKPTLIELGTILRELQLRDLGVKDKFTQRMCGRNVTIKYKTLDENEFIAKVTMISYHALYRRLDKEQRKAMMLDYFETMCNLADEFQQTIIIGGDFNLPVLDWKDKVETKFSHRVFVALYVGTPRHWDCDRVIDTFALVQPRNPEHQTAKSTFQETMAIYPFPMAGHVGVDQPTRLYNYPSDENQWFKYLHFGERDLKSVKDIVKEKAKSDIQKTAEKIQMKKDELSKERKKAKKEELQNELDALIEQKKIIGETWLSEPFTKSIPVPLQPPVPLWPNSHLEDVLDHDPIVTTITVILRLKTSIRDDAPTTSRTRAGASGTSKRRDDSFATSKTRAGTSGTSRR